MKEELLLFGISQKRISNGRFEFIEEFKLGTVNKEQIQNLLVSCFKEEEFKEWLSIQVTKAPLVGDS